MVTQVDVRINDVDTVEIGNLSSIIESMQNREFTDNIVTYDGKNDFVVTVKPGKLQALKDALRVILRIVRAERIIIET